MNQQQQNQEYAYTATETRSPGVVTTAMKTLAVVGIVALLALLAYVAVNFFGAAPNVMQRIGSGAEAAVVMVTSVFEEDEQPAPAFDEDTNRQDEQSSGVATSTEDTVQSSEGTASGTEDAPQIPASENARANTTNQNQAATPAPVAAQPATPVVTRIKKERTGPADLALTITATGAMAKVDGEYRFLAISPIPADKIGGVTFTVENLGGQTSKSWKFIARIPTKDDPDYRYESRTQKALAGGSRVEFTLGFDELPEDRGTIEIELEIDDDAKSSNNEDRVTVRFED